jgi:hypothetical protein
MERFGYPDFLLASADDLLDAHYVDRPLLRPILDAIVLAVGDFDGVGVQARKTNVVLNTPRKEIRRSGGYHQDSGGPVLAH